MRKSTINKKGGSGKARYLSGEVADDICVVSTPQSSETLLLHGSREALADTLVRGGQSTLLDHFILVLNQKLHALNRGSCGVVWCEGVKLMFRSHDGNCEMWRWRTRKVQVLSGRLNGMTYQQSSSISRQKHAAGYMRVGPSTTRPSPSPAVLDTAAETPPMRKSTKNGGIPMILPSADGAKAIVSRPIESVRGLSDT